MAPKGWAAIVALVTAGGLIFPAREYVRIQSGKERVLLIAELWNESQNLYTNAAGNDSFMRVFAAYNPYSRFTVPSAFEGTPVDTDSFSFYRSNRGNIQKIKDELVVGSFWFGPYGADYREPDEWMHCWGVTNATYINNLPTNVLDYTPFRDLSGIGHTNDPLSGAVVGFENEETEKGGPVSNGNLAWYDTDYGYDATWQMVTSLVNESRSKVYAGRTGYDPVFVNNFGIEFATNWFIVGTAETRMSWKFERVEGRIEDWGDMQIAFDQKASTNSASYSSSFDGRTNVNLAAVIFSGYGWSIYPADPDIPWDTRTSSSHFGVWAQTEYQPLEFATNVQMEASTLLSFELDIAWDAGSGVDAFWPAGYNLDGDIYAFQQSTIRDYVDTRGIMGFSAHYGTETERYEPINSKLFTTNDVTMVISTGETPPTSADFISPFTLAAQGTNNWYFPPYTGYLGLNIGITGWGVEHLGIIVTAEPE